MLRVPDGARVASQRCPILRQVRMSIATNRVFVVQKNTHCRGYPIEFEFANKNLYTEPDNGI